MNFINKILLLSIASYMLLGPISMAHAEGNNILMLFGYRYPPFYSVGKTNNSGSLHGEFITFLTEFKKAYPQYNIRYKCIPRGRVKILLSSGRADASSLTSPAFESDKLNKKVIYSNTLWKVSDNLVVVKDSKLKFNNINDLKGKSIAVIHGNGYGPLDKYFENGTIHKVSVYKTKQQLDMLVKGRVDAAICNYLAFPCHLKRCSFEEKRFRLIEKPLYTFPLKILAFKKHVQFINDINNFITSYNFPSVKDMLNGVTTEKCDQNSTAYSVTNN